ncbi:DUF6970 domain-containing protein [Aquimarina agarivorans]|uniref:DUF6970 domain-containing protein n=1 Tax=Aquimarina agarivorans TaxID=980584 RepID=UPI000248FD88|nr:hypothetical protein [Aquimarina agarivorans]
MKNLIKILAVVAFTFASCERVFDTPKCSNNPLEDVGVLRDLVANEQAQNPEESNGLEIVQYTFQNQTVYLVNDCINNCADALEIVYDCDENIICEFGGIAGLNTCPDFETEATNRKVLFSTRNGVSNCDKSVLVDPELFSNSKAATIIDAEVIGDCLHITFEILSTQDAVADVDLVGSGDIMESFPIQTTIKLVIEENFTFPAKVVATTSFDISSLIEPGETIILNLANFEEGIRYTRGESDTCKVCGLTQEAGRALLNSMLTELNEISESVVCDDASEWEFTTVGSKACGGPNLFLPYSTTIDVTSFLDKVAVYTKAEDDFNKKWGIVSTCDVVLPPTEIACQNGEAVLIN